MASPGEQPPRKVLQSWKEIAAYLGVTVRTVQRWESMGLPTYRQGAGKKARVFAYEEELQRWLQAGGAHEAERPAQVEESETVEAAGSPASETLRQTEEVAPGIQANSAFRYGRLALAGAALLGVIALAVALRVAGIWAPARVPYSWRLDQARLDILDPNDRLCWTVTLPVASNSYDIVSDKVIIADIDGDGRNEVLLNYAPENLSASGGSVLCFEHSGKRRWERKYGAPKSYGARIFEQAYKGKFLRPVNVGGRRLLLTVANHFLWYPSQVTLLDPRDGKVMEEYWHPGAIYHLVVRDFDADGEPEALFGAINNPGLGLGHAAVALLDLPFSKAKRQSDPGDARFPAATGGGERLYALFPLPDASRAVGQLPIMNEMNADENNRIRVQLPQPQGGIVYYLDYRFNILQFQTSDDYPAVHERLYRQHLLDHQMSPEEHAELGKVALFAAAPDGNSAEVNKLWKY